MVCDMPTPQAPKNTLISLAPQIPQSQIEAGALQCIVGDAARALVLLNRRVRLGTWAAQHGHTGAGGAKNLWRK